MARAREPGGTTVLRVGGIPIVVHGSWVVSIGLLALFARLMVVARAAPEVPEGAAWALSLGVGAGLAGCIVLHELAHAAVARAYGLPVSRIVLFAFGGVSQIEREAPRPRAEFAIAIAGPLTSVAIASVLAGIARGLAPDARGLGGAWGSVALFNLFVAIFNLMPAFPMDGGRLLRSALWELGRSRARATRRAVLAGRAFAGLLVTGGAVLFVLDGLAGPQGRIPVVRSLDGLWMMFVGWFLHNASRAAGHVEGGEVPNAGREHVP